MRSRTNVVTRKPQAHDRWACFACRWSVKASRVSATRKTLRKVVCPTCNKEMTWTGTAFRPPKKDDAESWYIAEKIIESGYHFVATKARRALPKTRRELKLWLNRPADEVWTAEVKLSWKITPSGSVRDLRAGRRVLRDYEGILFWHGGKWVSGVLRLTGHGGARLHSPVIYRADVAYDNRYGQTTVSEIGGAPVFSILDGVRVRLIQKGSVSTVV